jgi:hypothetical protein
MPLFPHAYAASLLKRDETGRTVFFPDGDNKRCYVVPDAETEQSILRKLKRIRLVELAAWVLLVAVLVGAIVATDGAVSIPKWLFILGFIIAALAIELPSEWARRKLARNLALRDNLASEPSLLDRLPGWAVVVIIALAVGVALYLGRMWPLKTITWLDDIPLGLHESKAIAKVAVFVAGTAAALWGGLSTVKRWFRPIRDHSNRPNEET